MICALINSNVVVSVQGLSPDQVTRITPSYQWVIDITSMSPLPGVGWSYDGVSVFTPPTPTPPPVSMVITKLAFRERFTFSELLAIQTAAATNFELQVLQMNMQVATFIDLTRSDTQAGVGLLVAMGLITSDRATTILTTPAGPLEVYQG